MISLKTIYAIRNGGSYKFEFNDTNAIGVPLEEEFWADLLKNSSEWGLGIFLQDWVPHTSLKVQFYCFFKLFDYIIHVLFMGTHEFHTMGIRALKPNCVKSLKKRARIFSFTIMAQNITLCVKFRIF